MQLGKGMNTEEQGLKTIFRGPESKKEARMLRKLKTGEGFIRDHERCIRRGARKFED